MNKRYPFLSINLMIIFFSLLFSGTAKGDIISSIAETDNWFIKDIEADKGWDYFADDTYNFREPTIVALIDTGCDYTHPLIQNALWVNTAEQNGIEGIDDDNNGYVDDIYGVDICNNDSDPMDDSVSSIKGHGTHVAGTILQTAKVTSDSNPFNIKIMIIKAGDAYGNFTSENVAKALYYAADNGADVINMSLSSMKYTSALSDAAGYASKSSILVASAGNKGYATSDSGFSSSADYYPAAYPFVIGVMSYDADHQLSYFSNFDFKRYSGAEYDIAAPGSDIYSCYYNSMYKNMKGTSMSAGIVSGCAALLHAKSFNEQTSYTPAELTAHIMESGTEDIAHSDIYGNSYTFRRINLYQLLSEKIQPKLILNNISISKDNTLTYTILNRGCNAGDIQLNLTGNVSDNSYALSSESIISLNALSSYTGSCTLPSFKAEQEMNISVHLTYKNASDKNDSRLYSLGSSHTFTLNPSSDTGNDIPLQGITLSPAAILLKCGESRQINVSYIPENTTDSKSITFTSSRPDIASVDKSGVVTAISSGNTWIQAVSSGGHERKVQVIVYTPDKIKINTLTAHLSSSAYNWTGQKRRPSVKIEGLKKGTDYLVRYSSPDSKNIGRYYITIQGIGSYTGEQTLSYDIKGYNGRIYTINGLKYKITSPTSYSTKNTGTVALAGASSHQITRLNIPNQIKIGGKIYKVVSIKAHAFKHYKRLSCVTIGKNVTSIGTYAFYGDTKLKILKGKSIQKIHIGAHAFKKTSIQW